MQPKYDYKNNLDRKFSFFKKDDCEAVIKQVRSTKLKIAIFMSFFMFVQFISITQYDKDSVSFQQKSVAMSSAQDSVTAPAAKLSKVDLEVFLLENLNKKSLSYEDMDLLIKKTKINKKEIPNYVYSHIVEKLKSNNEDLYKSEMKLLNESLSKIESASLINMLVTPEHKQKNQVAYNQSKKLLAKKYELTEQKIAEMDKK